MTAETDATNIVASLPDKTEDLTGTGPSLLGDPNVGKTKGGWKWKRAMNDGHDYSWPETLVIWAIAIAGGVAIGALVVLP